MTSIRITYALFSYLAVKTLIIATDRYTTCDLDQRPGFLVQKERQLICDVEVPGVSVTSCQRPAPNGGVANASLGTVRTLL